MQKKESSKGYRQTDIGAIPVDWDVKRIIDFTDCSAGGTPSTLRKEFWGGHIPWMNSGELNDKRIFDVEGRITEVGLRESSAKIIPSGSVLVGLAGQGKTRGTVAINRIELAINQSIAAIFPSPHHDADYLYFNLDNRYDELRSLSTGGEGRGGLNLSIIRQILIAFPKKEEQTAIAKVLLDFDALIAELEILIQKKRHIKTGAMQELLTGKRRLPGFSSVWKQYKLEELLTYEQPTKYVVSGTEYSESSGIPVLTPGKTFVLGLTQERHGIYTDLPVILFDDFTTASRYVDFPFKVKSSAVKMLRQKRNDVVLRFCFEKMQTIDFELGNHKRYWISEYRHIELLMPDYDEQFAIAELLSDMQAEIENLEQQKAKYFALKQGIMKMLFFGKIRLV